MRATFAVWTRTVMDRQAWVVELRRFPDLVAGPLVADVVVCMVAPTRPGAQEAHVTAATTLDDAPAAPRAPVRRGWLVGWYLACGLLGALAGAAVGFAVAPRLPASYTTQAELVIGAPQQPSVAGSPVGSTGWTDPAYAVKILQSNEIAVATSRLLDERLSPGQVAGQVTVDGGSGSPVVTISASANSPQLARDLANAVTRAYVAAETRGAQQRAAGATDVLNDLLSLQQKQLADVQKQLQAKVADANAGAASVPLPTDRATFVQATLDTDIAYQSLRDEAAALASQISATQDALRQQAVSSQVLQSGVDQVIPAPPTAASAPTSRVREIGIGALAGLILGGLVAWRRTEIRRTVDPAQAALILGAPLLGSIWRAGGLRRGKGFVDLAADTQVARELKVIASSLVLSAQRRDLGSVVVTSAHRGEGKSALARNLAAAGEYIGQPVLLADAGFGAPTNTQMLDLEDQAGLAELVDGSPPAQVQHYVSYGEGGRVPVIPLGRNGFATEPGRRLNEERRRNWAKALRTFKPMTPLVDAPAVNEHPLALQLAGGGGLLVVVSPRTSLADLEVIRSRADVADVPVLCFVVNQPRRVFRRRRRGVGRPKPAAPAAADSRQDEAAAEGIETVEVASAAG